MIPFLKNILFDAGELLKKRFLLKNNVEINFKSPKEIVTSTDKELEKFIISRIKRRFRNAKIISEEFNNENVEEFKTKECFIIDPIDGTNNFVHNVPFFAISIAYSNKGEILAGGVYNPILNEMFISEKAKGSFLNNKQIFVSKTDKLINTIAATGFACLRSDLADNNIDNLKKILPELRGLRRIGSAALDLCYTAAGRFDAFWEINLSIWDIAAGVLIVKEAGGKVTDFENKDEYIFKKKILGSNGWIHDTLLTYLM